MARCTCGYEFCYLCGVTWKNCDCRHWDEHRLREHAEEILDRGHDDDDDSDDDEADHDHDHDEDDNVEVANDVEVANNEDGEIDDERDVDPMRHRASLYQAWRARTVRRLMQELEENHECNHPEDEWERLSARRRCECCGDKKPRYVFRCGRCELRACGKCRFSRLSAILSKVRFPKRAIVHKYRKIGSGDGEAASVFKGVR
jgi:hypothetical protein